jgi:hypothetical protein
MYLKLKKYKLAEDYFRMALIYYKKIQDFPSILNALLQLEDIYSEI